MALKNTHIEDIKHVNVNESLKYVTIHVSVNGKTELLTMHLNTIFKLECLTMSEIKEQLQYDGK